MGPVSRFHLIVAALLLAVCTVAAPAYADTQSVAGCSGCDGYSFQATLTPSGGGNFSLTYTVSNNSGSPAFAYNWSLTLFGNSDTISNVSLSSVTETGSQTNFAGDFASLAGKSNNGNASCNGTISNALCVEPAVAITSLPSLGVGQSLTFNLTLHCTTGSSGNCTSADELAQFIFLSSGDCQSNTNANCYAISTEGTPVTVPEPSSLALLGASGLIGLCSFVRSKLRVWPKLL